MNKVAYDKEAYKEKKKKQLNDAYSMIDKGLTNIKEDNNNFFNIYLDIQSKFDAYTFRNAILIALQYPNATQLKDYKTWKEEGAEFLNYPPKYITVLEPGQAYVNRNGNLVTPYNPKQLLDIAETNIQQNFKEYDKKLIFQALIKASKCEIKGVDKLEEVCKWNKKENAILVERSEDIDKLICNLSRELAKCYMQENNIEISDNNANCVSYIICNKYNVKYSGKEIKNFHKGKDIAEISKELEKTKSTVSYMMKDIKNYLYQKTKDSKSKSLER